MLLHECEYDLTSLYTHKQTHTFGSLPLALCDLIISTTLELIPSGLTKWAVCFACKS